MRWNKPPKQVITAYKKIKGVIFQTPLQEVEEERSSLSRSSDERQEHSIVIEPDDPRIEIWKKHPGRLDVRGIDTPDKKKPKKKKGRTRTTISQIKS